MQLLEAYLAAVRTHLPRRAQNDVIEELRGEIDAAAADEEARLGRALELDEEDAIFKRWGHPRVLAGRYHGRRHLIGPELYPVYIHILKTAVWLAIAFNIIVIAFSAATEGISGQVLLDRFLRLPVIALAVFGCFTILFAVLDSESLRGRCAIPWRARDLPVPGVPRVPLWRTLCELVTALIMLWSALAIWHQPEWLHMNQLPVTLAPHIRGALVVVFILLGARLAQQFISAAKPGWFGFRAGVRIATGVALIVLGGWLEFVGVVVPRDAGAQDAAWIDAATRVLLFGFAVSAVRGVITTYREWRRAGVGHAPNSNA